FLLSSLPAFLSLTLAFCGTAFAQDHESGEHKEAAPPAKAPHRKWQDLAMPPARAFAAPKPERHVLKNGVAVFLLEDHELPTIDLVTLVRTGDVCETREKAGLASMCGEVMRSGGTTAHSGDELDQMLESMGASVEVGIST